MNKQKEELIKGLINLEFLIPSTINALKDIPDIEGGNLYTLLNPGELRVAIDYPAKYLMLRRTLAKNWQYVNHYFDKLTGSYYVSFGHKILDVKLELELSTKENNE